MLFTLCLLLSSSQLTSLSPSLFPGIRLIADFIATSFTHAFFLTERPFFQLTHDNLPAKFSHDNLLVTSDLRFCYPIVLLTFVTLMFVTLLYFLSELKNLPSFSFSLLPSERMTKGLTNDEGLMNDDGLTNDEGLTNDKGLTNDEGLTNDKGITNNEGLMNDEGLTNDKGLTNDDGLTNDEGLTNDKGLTNDDGLTNDKGLTNDEGPTNDEGLTLEMSALSTLSTQLIMLNYIIAFLTFR